MKTPNSTTINLIPSHVAVAIYNSPAEIEAAIIALEHSNFDFLKLTNIDRHTGRCCDRWGHQCTGLYCAEIPIKSVPQYETALQIDKSILIAQWTAKEVSSGCEEINRTHPESIDDYMFQPSVQPPDLRV